MKPAIRVRNSAGHVMPILLMSFLLPSCMKNAIEPVAPANVRLQPSYYNGGNPNFGWSLMKAQKNIKTVRIEIEPSISITQAKSWISQAKSNGFAIIATYHKASVLGSDPAADLTAAANWWNPNYKSLSA